MKRLQEMREAIDTAEGLSPAKRRAMDAALRTAETRWTTMRDEGVAGGLETAKADYAALKLRVGEELPRTVRRLVKDVRSGRVSAADARKKLQDVMVEHNRRADQYEAILAADDLLADRAAMTPDEVQEEMLSRFPALRDSEPSFDQLVQAELANDRAKAAITRGQQQPEYDAPSADDLT